MKAIEYLLKAARLGRELADVAVEGWAHYNLGIGYTDTAETDKAREHYQNARAAFAGGTQWELARTEAQLGNLSRERGDHRQAEEHYRRFEDLASGMPPEHRTHRLKRLNEWRLRSQMGESGILDEIRAARKDYPPNHPRSYMGYLLLRSELELEEQFWDDARAHARTVLEEARSRQDAFFEATAQIVLGNLESKDGNSRGAQAALLEARQRAAGLGNEILRADVELSRAELPLQYPELGDNPETPLASAKQVFPLSFRCPNRSMMMMPLSTPRVLSEGPSV